MLRGTKKFAQMTWQQTTNFYLEFTNLLSGYFSVINKYILLNKLFGKCNIIH